MTQLNDARILMYSHDTFGLGHLRRCRTIAHSLVENFSGLSVLIISGSAIAGAFDFRARVDFVKIPSVIKLRNGEYTSLDQHIDLSETVRMRESIIRHTAETFRPDIFLVDKEPMGLQGEVAETLAYLKTCNTQLVLGLRDVMDSPALLAAEWERKELIPKIDALYDQIWVYGPENFYDPMIGMDIPQSLRDRIRFVGFLERQALHAELSDNKQQGDYILVTTGGGGDGVELIRGVMAAYEHDASLTFKTLIVLGPYMPGKERDEFVARGNALASVEIINFDSRMEELIASATAVVSMGGYNTFCEILSFDKPALIVPRTVPREEQLIRTQRAAELDMVDMLLPEEADDPVQMARALKALPQRQRPSERMLNVIEMDGLTSISDIVEEYFQSDRIEQIGRVSKA
ncbi:glycosyltransferase family protein [Granulosicoccus antarcticus]|uniref:UDP-N-acetylglucosamine--N-acetylmuramyl-(Pentapeptide) pyrophosphoryl-undecaprenol N-acetylglucosamine transferase n=1 Tax=Granulosicoccus antarcticus IMCC3135 TaxID=1192854 RepID=A0A2Z2NWX3_9GAMM|nr:glycosyltransferase family protein [Granulosicoccus antarcticus]ASJ75956.1 UDP-N-acetylglucosamine--N-acetylmuramyl-(pentapeptide) pyrophosphoryl-undecaprenol N-acetylglucosamine transferase [Granulosicoccus antarcticus IMCC3135]